MFAEWWPSFSTVSDGFFQIAVYEWLGVQLLPVGYLKDFTIQANNSVCLKMTMGTKRTIMWPCKESKVLILTLTPAIPAPCCYVGKAPFGVGTTYAVGRYFPTSIIILHPWTTEDKPTKAFFSLNSCIHKRDFMGLGVSARGCRLKMEQYCHCILRMH